MKNFGISFFVGLVVSIVLGFFAIPWVFTAVKGMFETSDVGTLVGLGAVVLLIGPLVLIGQMIGAGLFILLEIRK